MLINLVYFVVWLLVVGLVFWLIDYVIGILSLPTAFAQVARAIMAIVGILIIIALLLQLLGFHSIIPALKPTAIFLLWSK